MFLQERRRHEAEGEPDKTRDDHDIVNLTEDRNPVGDQVERHGKIAGGEAEAEPGGPGSPRVAKDTLIESDFAPKRATQFRQVA